MKKIIKGIAGFLIVSLLWTACEKKELFADPKKEEVLGTASQAAKPPSTPSNDNCANATMLTTGVPLCNQTTASATVQSGEVVSGSCITSGNNLLKTRWYKFTAVAAEMYVDVEVIRTPWSCRNNFVILVYNTASCLPGSSSIIACETIGNDFVSVIDLTGLTIGNSYLVQVGYRDRPGTCNTVLNYCITVGVPEAACSSCSTPCGTACQYLTLPPSYLDIIAGCAGDTLIPRLEENTSRIMCYTFTAAAATVQWGILRSPDNYSSVGWELQTIGCTGVLQSGFLDPFQSNNYVLGSLNGLSVGQQYTMCFTITPSAYTQYTKVWPFFVGAGVVP